MNGHLISQLLVIILILAQTSVSMYTDYDLEPEKPPTDDYYYNLYMLNESKRNPTNDSDVDNYASAKSEKLRNGHNDNFLRLGRMIDPPIAYNRRKRSLTPWRLQYPQTIPVRESRRNLVKLNSPDFIRLGRRPGNDDFLRLGRYQSPDYSNKFLSGLTKRVQQMLLNE